jgi:acetolactate synthase-1/2/3 large subunit
VLVHVDAGTLNVGGALHQAQRNGTPVVIMAGRTPYSNDPEVPGHRDGAWMWPQEQLDQAGGMRAYCKWLMEVPRGRDAGRILRRAFQVAGSEPTGPSYVMLSREALMEPGGRPTVSLARPLPPAPDQHGLARLARMLGEAQRPVIVTGRVGRNPDSVAVLVRISELLGAPVLDERDRQNFPGDHRLYAGSDGKDLLKAADAVLIVDSQVPWVPALAAPPKGAQIGLIDVDPVKPTMPLWEYPVTLSLIADSAVALPMLEVQLQALATNGESERWRRRGEEVAARVAEIHASWTQGASGVGNPARAAEPYLAALNAELPEEAVVIEEAVTNRVGCIRQIRRGPGRYFQAGAPSLGWAIGAALGAKLARPDLPIVAVCGDGSFNFGVPTAALWSAHKAKAPFVTVILNNRAYNASKEPVLDLYPDGAAVRNNDFYETRLGPPIDYVALARACGGQGEIVDKPSGMGPALERALAAAASGQCTVLDVALPEI